LVLFLNARESPSHYCFWSETARPQIGLGQKIRVNPNYLVVFFTVATPTFLHAMYAMYAMYATTHLLHAINATSHTLHATNAIFD
jgi:hypothetical protein